MQTKWNKTQDQSSVTGFFVVAAVTKIIAGMCYLGLSIALETEP